MWNLLNLLCPVQDMCEYNSQERISREDLQNLVTVLSTAADTLTSEHPVWAEIKVFQNIQSKYKRILKCDKCLQLLQRVGHCLRKMVLLNLSKSFLDLSERFLIASRNPSPALFLPSRQQLEYVLIRTQSAAKLICEALKYSRETFCYLIQKLRIGHMILDLVMAASVTARVNILFKTILIQIFDMYKKVLPWRERLKGGTWKWPETVDLPNDLEVWLKPEAGYLFSPIVTSKNDVDLLNTIFKKTNDDHENDLKSVFEFKTKAIEPDCEIIEQSAPLNDNDLDYGEVIPRTEMPIQTNEVLKDSQKLLLQKILKVQSFKMLKCIWENIDLCSLELLPRTVSPKKIRLIEKMLTRLKESIVQKKVLNVPKAKRKMHIVSAVHMASLRLAKLLGFTEGQIKLSNNMKCRTNEIQLSNFEPVKTFLGLKQLFKALYQMLQSRQEYEKCRKLKKVYKQRIADIKLLKRSNEKVIAKKLIFCTSKVFLTMCGK